MFSVLIHWWVKVLVVCSFSVCLRLLVWFVQDSLVAICWERTSCPLVLFYILTDLKKHNTSFFMKGSKWPFSLPVKGLTVVSISRESVYQKLIFKCHTCDRRKFVRTVAHCFCHQHIAFVYIHNSSIVSTLVCFCFVFFYSQLKLFFRREWKILFCGENNWDATRQNQQNECAPTEDSDQPEHPPSLIRVFAARMKKAWVLSYPLSAQQGLWSDWVDAQADLSLRWAHTHLVGFVMSWLIWADRQNCYCLYSD